MESKNKEYFKMTAAETPAPFFSVVMPVYNGQKLAARGLIRRLIVQK